LPSGNHAPHRRPNSLKKKLREQKLDASRNKAFRALSYEDYVRNVDAIEPLLKKYPEYKPMRPCMA